MYVDDALGISNPQVGVRSATLPHAGGYYTLYGGDGGSGAARAFRDAPPQPLAPASLSAGASVYSRLGASACALDFNGDGVADLALGAPAAGWAWAASPHEEAPLFFYQGRVEVFFGVRGAGLPPSGAAPSVVLLPNSNLTFLGASLACDADLSGDGLPDLVVGSPLAAGPGGAVEAGRVNVFFSGAGWGAATTPPPLRPLAATLDAANFSAVGAHPFSLLGASVAGFANASALGLGLAGGDDAVALFGGVGSAPPSSACSAERRAVAALGWGAAVSSGAPSLLLVGAPGAREEDAERGYARVGALLAYLLPPPGSPAARLAAACRRDAPPAPLFSITSGRDLAVAPMKTTKLGASVAVGLPFGPAGAPHIALGMPCVDFCGSSSVLPGPVNRSLFNTSAGAVLVLPLSPALRGDLSYAAVAVEGAPFFPRAALHSALPDARFGARLGWAALLPGARGSGGGVQDLVVGAPQYTRLFIGAPPAGDSGRETGALFVFPGGAAFPRGRFCGAEGAAAVFAEGPVEHGRFGSSWAVGLWGVTPSLMVGAPRAGVAVAPQVGGVGDTTAEYGGAVCVFDLQGLNVTRV